MLNSQSLVDGLTALSSRASRTSTITIATPFPCDPGPSIPIDGSFEDLLTEKQTHHGTRKEYIEGGRSRVTIDVLPDLALLQIFDFYMYETLPYVWCTLVHVCQKWRNVVFGSPLRLNLRLFCSSGTPVRETLDVWPPLPIIVVGGLTYEKSGVDNIIAALEHSDRICQLTLGGFMRLISRWEKVLAAMLQPFPVLTSLQLPIIPESVPVVPATFLGGYAPRLQILKLQGIPFPGLPKLLLSTTHLVTLQLRDIPHSGYISPKAMVTCLSLLTRLKNLEIGFRSPRSRPDQRSRGPPPLTRTSFPILTTLQIKGVGEYLEDFVAQIDAPLLDKLNMTFSNQLILDTPQVTQFIGRTPKFKALVEAHIVFSKWAVHVTLPRRLASNISLELGISCRQSDWQLSSVAQVCSSSLPQALISTVEYLYIKSEFPELDQLDWQDDIENGQWLEIFRPFAAVKELYLSQDFGPHIAPVLKQLVEEGPTEVFLPALQIIFLEEPLPLGSVQEIIEQFVTARRLSSHPIALSIWNSNCYEARS